MKMWPDGSRTEIHVWYLCFLLVDLDEPCISLCIHHPSRSGGEEQLVPGEGMSRKLRLAGRSSPSWPEALEGKERVVLGIAQNAGNLGGGNRYWA